MAKWKRQGAVLVSGGRKIRGVLYTTESAPVHQVTGETSEGTPITTNVFVKRGGSANRKRRKHGRQTRTPVKRS